MKSMFNNKCWPDNGFANGHGSFKTSFISIIVIPCDIEHDVEIQICYANQKIYWKELS